MSLVEDGLAPGDVLVGFGGSAITACAYLYVSYPLTSEERNAIAAAVAADRLKNPVEDIWLSDNKRAKYDEFITAFTAAVAAGKKDGFLSSQSFDSGVVTDDFDILTPAMHDWEAADKAARKRCMALAAVTRELTAARDADADRKDVAGTELLNHFRELAANDPGATVKLSDVLALIPAAS